MMSSEASFSILLWCRPDLQSETTQLRVVRVDTGKGVNFSESSFLLRISLEENGTVLRCLIRHLTSGREAYIQSGQAMQAFIKDCLLKNSSPIAEPAAQHESIEIDGEANEGETEFHTEATPNHAPREELRDRDAGQE